MHVDDAEHLRRISEDTIESAAAGWRQHRRHDFDQAMSWLAEATTIVDTTAMSPDEVAAEITRQLSLS